MRSFTPIDDATVTLSPTTSASTSTLKKVPTGTYQVRVVNAGPNLAFVAFGDSNAATTSDIAIPSGVVEVLTIRNNPSAPETGVSAICASGSATVYVTTGHGL